MLETTEVLTLNKSHKAAMMKADTLAFHYYTVDGKSFHEIRASKSSNLDQPWNAWTVEIPIGDTIFEMHDNDTPFSFDYGFSPQSAAALCYLYPEQTRRPLYTTLSHIRTGDNLRMLFTFSAGNRYLSESLTDCNADPSAKLYKSTLHLLVNRNGKERSYHIETSISPMNSASMIRLNT